MTYTVMRLNLYAATQARMDEFGWLASENILNNERKFEKQRNTVRSTKVEHNDNLSTHDRRRKRSKRASFAKIGAKKRVAAL
jgi:hypothetical protein